MIIAQEYIGRIYAKPNGAPGDAAAMQQSTLYPGLSLTSNAYDMEQFIVETVRNAVKNNPELEGIGVMFEPNQFQSNLRHYGFYIDMSSADAEVDAYASYEEYAKEDSYRVPAQENRIYISAPYRDGDLLLIAYGTPIVYNGSVIGVVISVIDLSSFSSLQISDNNYTSMWSTLYSGDGTIIWDSETLDDVGHNMVEFTPQADELEAIQAAMAQGDAFNMRKTREDGDQVSCFYSPLQVGGETWWSMTAHPGTAPPPEGHQHHAAQPDGILLVGHDGIGIEFVEMKGRVAHCNAYRFGHSGSSFKAF